MEIDGGRSREAPVLEEKDEAFDRTMKLFDQDAEEDKVRQEEPPQEQPPPVAEPKAQPGAEAKAKAKAKTSEDARLARALLVWAAVGFGPLRIPLWDRRGRRRSIRQG